MSEVHGDPGANTTIWPSIYPELLRLIEEHTTTLVFVNYRRLSERLALRLNELAGREVARAHHGSLAREARTQVEEALKRGDLKCLVATSSLELGIDMGAIDLVVQIESPGSVARGLQRIGRAGHQVGAASTGRIFPKFRGDLVECAVVTRRMHEGAIEETHVPRNALDVLSQQIVAACASDEWQVDDLFALVRRSYPYRELPRAQYDGVLDMLSGRYPSDDFAELRPRIVWDRIAGQRHGPLERPPAGRRECRHDPRPRPVRRVPGRRLGPRRRAGRGDGLRGARRPGVRAGRVVVAHRAHHPRPRARLPRARPARSDPVLEGRGAGPPGRAGPGDRRRSCARRARSPRHAP